MTARRLSVVAVLLWVTLAVPALVLLAVGPAGAPTNDLFAGLGGESFLLLAFAYVSVGAVVAVRVPGNRIGWVFCLVGLANVVQLVTWQYADVGLDPAHSLPAAGGALAANAIVGEQTAGWLALPLLLFPDGHLPTRRWRPAVVALLLGMALLVLAGTLTPGRYDEPFAQRSNPLGIPGARGVLETVDIAGWLLVLGAFVLGAAAMVVRLRRARGVERQQLKLVLAVGSVAAIAGGLLMSSWLVWPHGDLQLRMAALGLVLTTFPVSAGIAILRYRLYDIDVVVNRTVVYGSVTALLAGAYAGLVLLFQLVLRPVTGGGGLAVALSTLAVAALFRPARNRVQALVDRRFYRRKYDAEQTLAAFAARLRDEVDLRALEAEIAAVVAETVQPAHVSLWLRDGIVAVTPAVTLSGRSPSTTEAR